MNNANIFKATYYLSHHFLYIVLCTCIFVLENNKTLGGDIFLHHCSTCATILFN